MIGGREWQLSPAALPPCRHAEPPFRRDVHSLGLETLDDLADPPRGAEREADLGIGRTWDGPELLRRDDLEPVPDLLALAGDPLQRADHAVHLRSPGVGHQQDAHQAASAVFFRSA